MAYEKEGLNQFNNLSLLPEENENLLTLDMTTTCYLSTHDTFPGIILKSMLFQVASG
jgi:hypothetical protein